jgi:hypothetical protein
MPVFDTNDSPIAPEHFANKLIGALCEVTFTLKHYAIGVQRRDGAQDAEAHDIFSAQVEVVAVLKNPPLIARSPYKGRISKRPHHKAQVPTRGEQINAAAAFISHPEYSLCSETDSQQMVDSMPLGATLRMRSRTEGDIGVSNPSFDSHLRELSVMSSSSSSTTIPNDHDISASVATSSSTDPIRVTDTFTHSLPVAVPIVRINPHTRPAAKLSTAQMTSTGSILPLTSDDEKEEGRSDTEPSSLKRKVRDKVL